MRYFFIDDIHSEYDKMILALERAGFDKEKDTLVSLGDLFDRGTQTVEVLNYIMSLPNRVLIWGNHDLRLEELVKLVKIEEEIEWFDVSNGTYHTILDLVGDRNKLIYNLKDTLKELKQSEIYKTLTNYFNECVYAIEFKDLIGTHAWTPHKTVGALYFPIDNWREETTELQWYRTTWAHIENCITNKIFPDKKLIVGHWWAWKIAKLYGERDYEGITKYESPDNKLIAIDGCSNSSTGDVSIYIYETDEEPILYKREDLKC